MGDHVRLQLHLVGLLRPELADGDDHRLLRVSLWALERNLGQLLRVAGRKDTQGLPEASADAIAISANRYATSPKGCTVALVDGQVAVLQHALHEARS